MTRVGFISYKSRDEDSHVRDENDPKKTTVEREDLMAQISDEPSLRFVRNIIFQVTIPNVPFLKHRC